MTRQAMDMGHMAHLERVCVADCEELRAKESTYKGSWKRRGGTGAWNMLARKLDRLEEMHSEDEDIFGHILSDSSGRDGSVLAEVRDLRRYLLLVEAEMYHQWALRDMAGPGAKAGAVMESLERNGFDASFIAPGCRDGTLGGRETENTAIPVPRGALHSDVIDEDRRAMLKRQRAEMLAELEECSCWRSVAVAKALQENVAEWVATKDGEEDIGELVGRKVQEVHRSRYALEVAEQIMDLNRALESEENLRGESEALVGCYSSLVLDTLPILKKCEQDMSAGAPVIPNEALGGVRQLIHRAECLAVPPEARFK